MSDGEQASEDSIKAAVRDAAKKTQDRLAAYQKKQALKAAAVVETAKEKTKEKEKADNTVARIHALVNESKRLTTKSRELNTQPDVPATPATRGSNGSSAISSTPKGKKLSEIFQTLGPTTPGGSGNASLSGGMDAAAANKTPSKGKKLSKLFQSMNNVDERAEEEDDDGVSVQEMVESTISQASLSHMKQRQKLKEKRSSKQEEDSESEDDDQDDSSGEFSILSMVENKKPRPTDEIVENMAQEDIDDMIEEYYTESKGAAPDMDASLPFLEAILETPKPMAPKPKVGAANNKKNRKLRRPQSKEEKAEEVMDSSMPILAPFETPKVERPKLQSKGSSPSMTIEEGEASLSLSQVMRNPMETDDSGSSAAHSKSRRRASNDYQKDGDNSGSSAAHHRSRRRASNEFQPPQQQNSARGRKLNLAKLTLVGDNPNSSSRRSDDDDDNRSVSSAVSTSSRSRRSRRNFDDSRSLRSNRSRSKSVSNRRKPNRRSSLNGETKREKSPKRGLGGANVSLSIINKYHQKAEESLQSFQTDDGSSVASAQSKSTVNTNSKNNKNNNNDKPELNGSDKQLSGSSSTDGREEMGNSSSDALSENSSQSRRSIRRGRSAMSDRSLRRSTGGMDSSSVQRSRSRSAVRRGAPAGRSVSRSASARRGGRRPARRESLDGDPLKSGGNSSLRDVSARNGAGPPLRRTRTLQGRDGNNSMRDVSSRRRRTISNRRGAGPRRRGSEPDLSEASTADEILSSLDPNDIKIVGSNDSSDKGRSSKRNSLAGLSKLQQSPKGSDDDDDDDTSVAESVKSTTKKSRMGKFARKVGRKLTMKKKKKKKEDGNDTGDDDDEDETEADMDLQSLADEYDKEEEVIEEQKRISGGFEASFSELDDLADDPEEKKSKKKRGSIMVFKKFRKVGSKMAKKKKKKKDSKGSEVLGSDSDSDNDELELLGSEYSGGTMDRSQSGSSSDEDEDGQDFAQLQIDGDKASIAMCGSDASLEVPQKGRQARSAATMRRHRADRQRAQTLQAVLGTPNGQRRGNGDDDGSVMTTERGARARRNKSLRTGRIPRANRGDDDGMSASRLGDTRRHKSLKGRVVGEVEDVKTPKKVRRTKSVEGISKHDDDDSPPPFDWEAYSAEQETKKGKDKKKTKTDIANTRRMTGGLSKVIYASQTVAS